MVKNFKQSLAWVLESEGGYTNNPSDLGGATNYGITKSAWQNYLQRQVSDDDIKNLSVNVAFNFYKKRYWDICECDYLPSGIDYCVFDFAVNSGCGRSAKFLQKILGVVCDGIIGNQTILACNNAKDKKIIIGAICAKRIEFLRALKTYSIFGKGWADRVQKVGYRSMEMAL